MSGADLKACVERRPLHPGRHVAAAVVWAAALAGCAMSSPPRAPATEPLPRELPFLSGSSVLAEWQHRLEAYLLREGTVDATRLTKLPALRSPAVERPGQIVFAATDIEASASELDGFDAFGLLLGKQDVAPAPRYVFIVGTVARGGYRPTALTDVRVVALSVRGGRAVWEGGSTNAEALARYVQRRDTSTALRFPAVRDRFLLTDCLPAICVDELNSGARWTLFPASAEPAPAPPRAGAPAS